MKGAVFVILLYYQGVCSKILEYKFGLNYGRVFNDYTNNQHYAVNGKNYDYDDYDTTPTDRGAYFHMDNKRLINLPPNELSASVNFSLPSTFTINTWILPLEKGYIFTRYLKSTIYISIIIIDTYNIQMNVNSQLCTSSDSSFQLNDWILVSGALQVTTVTVYLNNALKCTSTLSSMYSDSSGYNARIGNYLEDKVSFSGFMWYFVIDDIFLSNGYMWSSGNTCIVSGCNSTASCTPGIVDLINTNLGGCIPKITDFNKNVNGISCNNFHNCWNYGCNTTSCLDPGNTTPYTSNSSDVVPCSDATYLSGSSCLSCYGDCATCDQTSICLTCLGTYASPTSTLGCKCNTGYYNETSLITSSSCISCYSDCSDCTEAYKCTSCKAYNSKIDANIGCVCPSGYYNNTSLSTGSCLACYLECSSCNNSNTCLTCISNNSYPDLTQGCLCNSGYYGSGLLTSASSCVICDDECSTCNQKSVCLKCKAQFASPGTTGCSCWSNYQGTHPLNSSDSCYKCNSDCGYCNNTQTCINCTDPNAIPSSVSGCNCKPGYYYDSNRKCQTCSLNCLTCSNNTSCTECKGANTLIDSSNFCNCSQGFYVASRLPTVCSPCNSLCTVCTSANNCLKCVDNAFLQESQCYCELGYGESLASCVLKYFTGYLSVDSKNIIKITFSENPSSDLNSQDFGLEINGTAFSWTFSELNSSTYYIYLKFTTDIAQNTPLNITIFKSPLYSNLGSQLDNYYYKVSLSSYSYPVSASIQAIAGVTSGGTKAATTTAIASALVGNPASSWVLINTIQFIIYLPLNDNPLTPGLQAFFNSFSGYNMIPNLMLYIFDSNCTSAPYTEASNFGFSTSVFWINAGPTVIILLFLIFLLPFIYLFSKFQIGKKTLKLGKYLGNYRYGIFLRFWIQAYLELGFFSLIQLKSVIFIQAAYKLSSGYFNIGSATIIIVRFTQILIFLTPSGLFVSSFISYTRIVDKKDDTYHKTFGSLFSEFKNDQGFLSTQYYLIFFIRRISYILSQVYLNSFPYTQAGVNIGFSLIQTVYLLYYTPFKEKDILFSCITGEICVLVVLCLTTFYLGNVEPELSYILETICVYTVIGCMGIQFIISVYSVIKACKRMLRKIFKYRALAFIESYNRANISSTKASNKIRVGPFPTNFEESPTVFST